MNQTHTCCRSETGITVGLVDSMISISRVLAHRDFNPVEVTEALKDLRDDPDIRKVFEEEVPVQDDQPWKVMDRFRSGNQTYMIVGVINDNEQSYGVIREHNGHFIFDKTKNYEDPSHYIRTHFGSDVEKII